MAIDWNKVIEQSLANAPLIIGASIAGLIKLRKLDHGQSAIKKQLDGHTKMLARSKKMEGKYEGAREAKNDSRHDQDVILKAVDKAMAAYATAQKRRGLRRTDK